MDEELPTIELQGRTHQLSGSIYQSSLKGTKHYVATPRLILPVNEEQGLGPRNTTVKIVPRTMDMMENYSDLFRLLGDSYKLLWGGQVASRREDGTEGPSQPERVGGWVVNVPPRTRAQDRHMGKLEPQWRRGHDLTTLNTRFAMTLRRLSNLK